MQVRRVPWQRLRRAAGLALAAALVAFAGPHVASAFELLPPTDRGGFAADAPLVVRIGDPALTDVPTVFVIDGLDVTQFARREGDRWILEFPAELAYGEHAFTVYWLEAGQERQRSFPVPVLPPERGRLDANAYVDAQLSDRVADNAFRIPGDVDRAEGTGAIQLATELSRGPLSFSAGAPLFYDSAGREGALGRRWDAGDYLGVLRFGPVALSAGQHAPAPSSLLLQGFYRRGLSLRLEGPQGTFLSPFLFHTEPVTGLRETFGIEDEDQRLRGMSLGSDGVRLPRGLGTLAVSATWIRAAGGEGGAATAGLGLESLTERGEGWDLGFDLQLLEDRVRLGGEWARTRFDFDGGGGAAPERDGAWMFYARVVPLQGTRVFDRPVVASLEYEERFSGYFFRSLGNPGAPADLHTRNARATLSWWGFTLDLSHARVGDNQDGNEEQLTYRDDTWAIDATFQPMGGGEAAWRRWLGNPVLQAGWSRQRTKPIANVVEEIEVVDPVSMMTFIYLVPDPYNQTVRTEYAAAGSSYERWSWSASHTRIRSDDATGLDQDVISKSTGGQIDLRLHPRLSLSANLQRDVTRLRDPALKTTSKLYGGSLQLVALPGTLDASLRADWTQTQDSERSIDVRTWTFTAYASWHVIAPQGARPGLTLTALGTYQDVIDEVNRPFSTDAYQAFLRAELRWSGKVSRGGT